MTVFTLGSTLTEVKGEWKELVERKKIKVQKKLGF